MTSLYFTSISGAPGVTTTSVGLTLGWHRPAILLEADTSRTSSVLPGYLAGQIYHDIGLSQLSVAHQHGQLSVKDLWDETAELEKDRLLVPGFSNVTAGRGAASLWQSIAPLGDSLADAGTDLIIDASRWQNDDPRASLMNHADVVVLMLHPTLPDVAAAAAHIRSIRASLDAAGHGQHLCALLTEIDPKSYPLGTSSLTRADIHKFTGIPVIGKLPYDSRSAAVYSYGIDRAPRFSKAPLQRALPHTREALLQFITDRETALGEKPQESPEEEELR